MAESLPVVRWGVVATGAISSWFVSDLVLSSWPNKRANHIIQAIGSSSQQKGEAFVKSNIPPSVHQPTVYATYTDVYADPDVDCVYIGTPHSFHKQNCLDAISAGKNVLCEKPFTMNAAEAAEVFAAADAKGVFIMEAVWTRFFPLVRTLHKMLHEDAVIGQIQRAFCDFALYVGDIDKLPGTNRYRDPALGAGSLLDLGVYGLTWGLLTLNAGVGHDAEEPEVQSMQTLQSGVDIASTFLLHYPSSGRQAVLSSTTNVPGSKQYARIEGSSGTIFISGPTPSRPASFEVRMHGERSANFQPAEQQESRTFEFENPGRGYYWMADAVALDLKEGKKENAHMPWRETQRVMEIMDGIRRRGGARFPVDDW